MQTRRNTVRILLRKQLLCFLLCSAMLILSLLLGSDGSVGGAVLGFAAPSVEADAAKKPASPVKVSLAPTQTDILTSSSDTVINLSLPQNDKPTILIYHTHTLEAYTPTDQYPYEEHGGKWRTDDNTRNIVAVGEALAEELRGYGFNVLHDITNHEPPKLSTAYERSVTTMESYKKKYPSLIMYIDLHRDACGSEVTSDYCVIDGEKTAKVMFVVGTGKGATGSGFDEMPDFESNYSYADAISEHLRSIHPELARDIRVKTGRYNQHISDCCLLIEVGHNMNTFEEALASVKHIASGIAAVMETPRAS